MGRTPSSSSTSACRDLAPSDGIPSDLKLQAVGIGQHEKTQ